MTAQRIDDARTLVAAIKVLDSYGWTQTARAVTGCAQDIIDGKIDPAPAAEAPQ